MSMYVIGGSNKPIPVVVVVMDSLSGYWFVQGPCALKSHGISNMQMRR